MPIKKAKYLIFVCIVTFFLGISSAFAQTHAYQPLAPIDGYVETQEINSGSLNTYLNSMFKLGIALCTGLAVLMIVIGGIQYASSDAWSKKSDGKERIFAALFGLLIALGSWVLLNTIDARLVGGELALKEVKLEGISTQQFNNAVFNTARTARSSSTNTNSRTGNTNNSNTNNSDSTNNTTNEPPLPQDNSGANNTNNPLFNNGSSDNQNLAEGELYLSASLNEQQKEARLTQIDNVAKQIAMNNVAAQFNTSADTSGSINRVHVRPATGEINSADEGLRFVQTTIAAADANGLRARVQTEDVNVYNSLRAAGVPESNLFLITSSTSLKIEPGFYLWDK